MTAAALLTVVALLAWIYSPVLALVIGGFAAAAFIIGWRQYGRGKS
jgi:hypothetical protein